MSINIERADKIDGWMMKEELVWLALQARQRKSILEVGSYKGRSTCALADNTEGSVTAVDTWLGSVEHGQDLARRENDYLRSEFDENLKDLIASGKVRPYMARSLDAAAELAEHGKKFDMIFIDASHLYCDVRADIEAWLPLLAPGGLFCGHDLSRYSGLDQAVRESLPDFRMMAWPGSIWYVGDAVGNGRNSPYVGPRRLKKTIFTLNVGMVYAPDICAITYPLLRLFADKCGADFHIITERKFPWMPLTYEKLQIFELGREMGNDWNIFFDSDALVNPQTFDPTEHMHKDTVLHNGRDMSGNRWKYDNVFRRDGRHIGSGNWFTVASDWCLDLWRPIEDLTLEQMLGNISPTPYERAHGITSDHLIDDYALSRNIAKFGLKFDSYLEITKRIGRAGADEYFWHHYTVPLEDKLIGDITELPKEDTPDFKGYFYKREDGKVVRKGRVTLMREVVKRWGLIIGEPEAVPDKVEV